jgi:hypothetical protein
MNNRENIKWAPFNSVINGNQVLNELANNKNKITKPILSEEQIELLDRKIINSYTESSEITISYFKNNYINEVNGIITKLDPINKKIVINNKIILYFNNIINIL